MARVPEQFMGQDGGEMLERHGRRQAGDRGTFLDQAKPPVDSLFERRQIVARLGSGLVEHRMLAAVDGFLGGEGLNLLRQLRRSAVAVTAHAFDKKSLALREGRR